MALTKALASATITVFLADAEQRIYDFRPGVRPERIDLLRGELHPAETDLEADNYRVAARKSLPSPIRFSAARDRCHTPTM